MAISAMSGSFVPASASRGADAEVDSLLRARDRLLRENASLRARLSLSRSPGAYLVVDLEALRLDLELQGLSLARLPVRATRLNRHAQRLLEKEGENTLLEDPFILQEERWFDPSGALAWKDSTGVPDAPDTTGARMEAVRRQPVTALLIFDRRLVIVLRGDPPRSFLGRVSTGLSRWLRAWSNHTPEGVLREIGSEAMLVTLEMAPADVRILAPSVSSGTRVVLIP